MKSLYTSTKKISGLLIIFFMCITLLKGSPLNGTYTINKTGSGIRNFTSFSMAVDSLMTNGVSGPVHIKVSSDSYTEQIQIGAVSGASFTNTITFQSASGDSSKVILTSASNNGSVTTSTVRLNAANFVSFSKMTIERTGLDSIGAVIWIDGYSTFDSFSKKFADIKA